MTHFLKKKNQKTKRKKCGHKSHATELAQPSPVLLNCKYLPLPSISWENGSARDWWHLAGVWMMPSRSSQIRKVEEVCLRVRGQICEQTKAMVGRRTEGGSFLDRDSQVKANSNSQWGMKAVHQNEKLMHNTLAETRKVQCNGPQRNRHPDSPNYIFSVGGWHILNVSFLCWKGQVRPT